MIIAPSRAWEERGIIFNLGDQRNTKEDKADFKLACEQWQDLRAAIENWRCIVKLEPNSKVIIKQSLSPNVLFHVFSISALPRKGDS